MSDDDESYWRPAFDLMLEEARRSIDRQAERLQAVRERCVGLVGFGALVAAGLGLSDEHLGFWGWVAVVAFVIVAAAAIYVLWPREFQFELSARRIEAWLYLDETPTIEDVVRSTAVSHDENHAYNHDKLVEMHTALTVGICALAVQTAALVIRLVM